MAEWLVTFIPRLKTISFDPNLILVVVLPPILYYAAFSISYREFKRNSREIFSSALGLVILTTLVIGIIFKWIFPPVALGTSFCLWRNHFSPHAVATTTIMKRFAISPRLLAIVEGASGQMTPLPLCYIDWQLLHFYLEHFHLMKRA